MNAGLVIIISVFMAMGGLTQFATAHSGWTLTVNALNTINGQNILFSVYGPSGQFLTQGTAGGVHNSQQASFSISGIAVGDIYKVCVQDANFASRGMNCQQYTHSGGDEFQTIMFPDFEGLSLGGGSSPTSQGDGGPWTPANPGNVMNNMNNARNLLNPYNP